MGLKQLMGKLQDSLGLSAPLKIFIAGGMATHLYTANRITTDVDAEFSKRFIVPDDILVETGEGNLLYLDLAYNSSFALMHEDYLQDAIRVPIDAGFLEVFVLSPVDLIVSKIARLSGPDLGDIESIIRTLRVTPDQIEQRANEAMLAYIGDMRSVRTKLQQVLALARQCRA